MQYFQPRSTVWWDDCVLKEWEADDSRWHENFRMPYHMLHDLEEQLCDDISPHPLHVRKDTINSWKCLCVGILTLASCSEYRLIGELFGISAKSVSRCTMKVCKALVKRRANYIYHPDRDEAILIAQRLEQSTGYPQGIGAIDGTHIAITPPEDGSKDYLNRKGYASYNVQAYCDDKLVFRDVCIKHPGSNHDAAVFRDSSLFMTIRNLPKYIRKLDGVDIPLHILGDPAYPMSCHLIKGYTGKASSLPDDKQSFNVYHSGARNCVERAFGRLKSRWRRILKKVDMKVENAPLMIMACFILHNFCERSTICQFDEAWNWQCDPELANGNWIVEQPPCREENDNSPDGVEIREAIRAWLSRNRPLLKSVW